MRRLLIAVVAACALGVLAAPAQGQSEPEFTPIGYEFCGWRDFEAGEWTFDDPEPGVFLVLFAREMTCTAARRNYARLRYTQLPPHRPVKPGYRCRTLDSDHEYSDVRCSKIGRPRVAFRYQTGA